MIPTIKAFRSTFNLLLSIVELFIGLAFAVKVFGPDLSARDGLIEYVEWTLGGMGAATTSFVGSTGVSGSLAFLVLVLGFMLFSMALIFSIPIIMRQAKQNEIEEEYD